eukprot:1144445-Pelagomonas_calceolata.AAC.4
MHLSNSSNLLSLFTGVAGWYREMPFSNCTLCSQAWPSGIEAAFFTSMAEWDRDRALYRLAFGVLQLPIQTSHRLCAKQGCQSAVMATDSCMLVVIGGWINMVSRALPPCLVLFIGSWALNFSAVRPKEAHALSSHQA